MPLLVNYVPDTISDKFITSLASIDKEIVEKISEIKYDPNDVDDKRFLLIMSDSNKAYVTLDKFLKINNYNEIMERVLAKYQDKIGTLYLDEGEYFVVDNEKKDKNKIIFFYILVIYKVLFQLKGKKLMN